MDWLVGVIASYRQYLNKMLACRVPPCQHYRPFISTAVAILALSLSLSCQSKAGKVDAKVLSDAFMADLIANHLDGALSKMDPAFVQMAGGREKAIGLMEKIFDYCGRPLNSAYQRDEAGFYAFTDGRKKPMRKFYYATPTTQRPEGGCYFSVMVVPGDHGGYTVVAATAGKPSR